MDRKVISPTAEAVVSSDNTQASDLLQSTVDAVTNNSQFLQVLSANTDKDRDALGLVDPSMGQPLAGGEHNYQQLNADNVQNEHMYTKPEPQTTYQPLGSTSPHNVYEVPQDETGSNEVPSSSNVRESPSSILHVSPSPRNNPKTASQLSNNASRQHLMKIVTTFRMSLRRADYFLLVVMAVTVAVSILAFILSISSLATCDCMSTSTLYDLSRCVPTPVENCTLNLYDLNVPQHLVCSTKYTTLAIDDMYTSSINCAVTGDSNEMYLTTGNLEYDSLTSSQLLARCSCTVFDVNQVKNRSNPWPLVCRLLVTRCPLL